MINSRGIELDPLKDSITHVNIYSKGSTELGRFLTNMNNFSVVTPHGEFKSVESYWHWLKVHLLDPNSKSKEFDPKLWGGLSCFDSKKRIDHIFKMVPQLKPLVSEVVQGDEFRNIIKDVLKTKILSYPQMLILFVKNELPYTHYYFYGNKDNPKIHDQPNYQWIPDYLNELKL